MESILVIEIMWGQARFFLKLRLFNANFALLWLRITMARLRYREPFESLQRNIFPYLLSLIISICVYSPSYMFSSDCLPPILI
jgi:hypothetical protein